MIFNSALAALQQRFDHLEQVQVSRSEVERAADYLRCAVNYYDDESARQNAIEELFDEAMGMRVDWEHWDATTSTIKRCTWYGDFLIGVLELKNTLGIHGDAHFQAILDYSKIVSQNKVRCLISTASNPVFTFFSLNTRLSGSTVTFLLSSLASLQTALKFPSRFALDRCT